MKKFLSIVCVLAIAISAFAQDGKKFEIKSGIAKMVTEVMGQKIESTVYFDNYGALEASKMNANGMEICTINKEGKTYMVNYTAKNVQTVPQQADINFLNLTEDVMKQYKIGMVGFEKVGERDCQKYTYETSVMGQTVKSTAWVWKGLTIKNVTEAGGVTVTITAAEIQENAEIDPAVFEVPTF